jgi:hypothetical protein
VRLADREVRPGRRWVTRKLIVAIAIAVGALGLFVGRGVVVDAAAHVYSQAAKQLHVMQHAIDNAVEFSTGSIGPSSHALAAEQTPGMQPNVPGVSTPRAKSDFAHTVVQDRRWHSPSPRRRRPPYNPRHRHPWRPALRRPKPWRVIRPSSEVHRVLASRIVTSRPRHQARRPGRSRQGRSLSQDVNQRQRHHQPRLLGGATPGQRSSQSCQRRLRLPRRLRLRRRMTTRRHAKS